MLRIIRSFSGKAASDAKVGDLNGFLRDVLIEVAGENYRQMMYEAMALASEHRQDLHLDLDPPLRANERVMSGLFATAISRVALRSRTEVRIDRPERDLNVSALTNDVAGEETPTTKSGRVDYLAWYGNRVIGIELKMAGINCEVPVITKNIERRWAKAVDQARTVQASLRVRQKEDSKRYSKPVSLALMVVVGRRSISVDEFKFVNDGILKMEEAVAKKLADLDPRPTFLATYTFPKEFRALVPRRRGKEAPQTGRVIYTPFVAFIAMPSVNTAAR